MKTTLLILSALLLIGCGGPAVEKGPVSKLPKRETRENLSTVEQTMLGSWTGEPVEEDAPDKDGDGEADESRNSAMFSPGLAETLGGYELVLKDNGDFRLEMTGQRFEGEWTLTGDKLTLNPELVLGTTRAEAEKNKDELALEMFDSNWTLNVLESGTLLEFPKEDMRPLIKFTKS